MSLSLETDDLVRLVRRVFRPGTGDRGLALLVEGPCMDETEEYRRLTQADLLADLAALGYIPAQAVDWQTLRTEELIAQGLVPAQTLDPLREAPQRGPGPLAQHRLHGDGLVLVVDGRRGAVGVDVVHLVRRDAGVVQRQAPGRSVRPRSGSQRAGRAGVQAGATRLGDGAVDRLAQGRARKAVAIACT